MCEFSRVVELRDAILNRKFEARATDEELCALAHRFDVHRIDELDIEYFITNKHDILGAYTLMVTLRSKVVRFVIDANEESIDVDEKFDIVLLSEDMARNNYEELKEFDIEIFSGDRKIDVGEIASQYLSLCVYM